jgi:hypothetical protein
VNMVLFQSLKHHLKNVTINRNSQASCLYPIKSAGELLSEKDNQAFIKTIKSLVKSSYYFNNFYLPALIKFAEFVQNLPENQRGFFDQKTEFLALGLDRASRTLSLCLSYFFPEETNFSSISQRKALLIYATFTAALFLDIGKIAVKYTVMLCHEQTYPLKKWDPYAGSMVGQGNYYRFDYVKENLDNLRRLTTPILARQLLDSASESAEKNGFNWIASNIEVLEMWFALLSGNEERIPMTSFMSVIPRADIEIIDKHRKEAKMSMINPAGEAFLQWLRKEIQEERILINGKNSELRIAEKEILFSSTLFQEFSQVNSSYKHPEIIERQFIDIAKLYQIPISELDQRYRAYGGLSGISDLGKRYRTMGGIAAVRENEKIATHHFIKGGIGLFSLIMSQQLPKHTPLNLPSNSPRPLPYS